MCEFAHPQDSSRWDECIEQHGGGEPEARSRPSESQAAQGVDWDKILGAISRAAAAYKAAQPPPALPAINRLPRRRAGVTVCDVTG